MAIGNVIEKHRVAYVYDERGRQIASIALQGNQPDDGLKGYTSSTVNIQRGNTIYTYNEHGRTIAARGAR